MSRCTRHPSDLSSSVGVCASCLRECLFSLIAAQARKQAAEEDERKSHPPPLIFPRSVSPYICRRSHDSNNNDDRRFYTTPQVGSTSTYSCSTKKKKKYTSKFSLLSTLFKSSRSVEAEAEAESDPRVSKPSPTASPISSASSSSSSSWFSSLLSSRRRKKKSRFCSTPPPANLHRARGRKDRGMSPSDQEEYLEEAAEGSPSASGYSSESSQGWWKSGNLQTPQRRKGGGTANSHHNRNVSGMAFCLSPLVRASPNRHRSPKDGGGLPASMVFSGDIGRGGSKCHLSTAASLCANRSRKFADFGRYNYNP